MGTNHFWHHVSYFSPWQPQRHLWHVLEKGTASANSHDQWCSREPMTCMTGRNTALGSGMSRAWLNSARPMAPHGAATCSWKANCGNKQFKTRINHYFTFPLSGLVLNAACSGSAVNEHELTHLFSAALSAANHDFTAKVQNLRATISLARFFACEPISIFPEQFFLPHLARIENCSFAGLFSLLFPWLEWNIYEMTQSLNSQYMFLIQSLCMSGDLRQIFNFR